MGHDSNTRTDRHAGQAPADPEISDTGIAVMCDIARAAGVDLAADKQAVLERLMVDGLVERKQPSASNPGCQYHVTELGQRLLDQRGVGVNEA